MGAVAMDGRVAPAEEDAGLYPRPIVAWISTALLMLLFALAYLDRQIISLMVAPIRAEFGVGDFEISLLQGFAFALLYAVCGLPLGMAVDRFPRRYIVLGGVIIWSLAATASGFATEYSHLLVARIFVGAGEAALAPAAYSLLADLFPRKRLTFALAVFMLGAALGAEGSLALGGFILHTAADGVTLPLLGHVPAWRFAFLVSGLPGIPLAFLALLIHEPYRRVRQPGDVGGGWAEVFAFLRARWRFFLSHMLGFALIMALVYARLAWTPTFLMRSFGWPVDKVGYILGAFGFVASVTALLAGGRIVDALFARGYSDAHFRYYTVGGIIMGLFGAAAYLSPSPLLFFVATAIMAFPMNMGAIGASAAQVATPAHLRGRVSALYLMAVALIGMTAGPASVGYLTEHVLHEDAQIGLALALLFGVLGPVIAFLFWIGLKPMREAVASMDAR